MHFHKAQEKPKLWGSFQDRQYSIWRNLEDIYGCDHESEVLIMPLFWGLPCLDYSTFGNHGTNHGATYKNESLEFVNADRGYIDLGTQINTASWTALSAGATVSYDSLGTTPHFIFGNYYNGKATVMLRLKPSDGTVQAYLIVEPNVLIGGSFLDLVLIRNQLHKVEITYDTNNGLQAYLDSAKSATSYASAAGLDATASATLRIGHSATYGSAYYFDGIIFDAYLAKAARTDDQMALFHDRPWDLYRRVGRTTWSLPAAGASYAPTGNIYGPFYGPLSGVI